AVMVIQDPVMSIASFIVAPPAMLVLRKLIRRIHSVARNRYTGGAQMLEAMQEAIQGIRIVKAFTLEEAMLQRLDRTVDAVEHESNVMARVTNRTTPVMETLGGIAVAFAVIYSGYRVILTGATPGEFFSFIAAFLLAYEPAKRLARLNLDLHSNLFGVKILFELLDGAPSEPIDDGKPPLRRQRGYVGQHVHRFGGSVRENIAFGRLGAPEEAIVAAAKAAHAHDFIMSFPQGYYTPVGEHGLQLSGGQRQRIAIARALIKDAPIILLDEATASLDSESERQVQDAMGRLCQGRTTLVVAHRLATIMHADRILVVEAGAVV